MFLYEFIELAPLLWDRLLASIFCLSREREPLKAIEPASYVPLTFETPLKSITQMDIFRA